ncbi:hypothetical protein F0562_017692 [Nyssa sinensis]|uniref:Chromo domain-containing protein n=1 Tax=Nyssa sinensis TaxID=561372 RepID=A0A5J4ZH75_9ASTE|nr:hypothetical protein F0562_017692 [Nyssa sinensis]
MDGVATEYMDWVGFYWFGCICVGGDRYVCVCVSLEQRGQRSVNEGPWVFDFLQLLDEVAACWFGDAITGVVRRIASFHMEWKALSWHYWLMESSPVASWEDFLVALRIRFGPSAFEDLEGAFIKLRQTRSVEEYQTTFEILSNKITGWNFIDLSMRFYIEGTHLLLQGLRPPENSLEEEQRLSKATLVEGRGIWLQLMEVVDTKGRAPMEPAIQVVLDSFQTVVAEPSGLLPLKSYDQQIQHHEAAKPTCVRPYCYPYYQKEEIKKLVNPNPKLSSMMEDGPLTPKPEKVLARRLKKKRNQDGIELLVQWKGSNKKDAAWVDLDELR